MRCCFRFQKLCEGLSTHSQGSALKAMKKLKCLAYYVRSAQELEKPDKEKSLVL